VICAFDFWVARALGGVGCGIELVRTVLVHDFPFF